MAQYVVRLENDAINDLKKIKLSGRKSDILRLEKIIKELSIHPREGIGSPERLKYHDNGEFWSREINKKDRIVYEIRGREILVIVYQVLGHYSDK